MAQIIKFYRTSDDYGCFSNFASFPIVLDEKVWPTSEHYFQAQKFEDLDYRERIRQTKSPMIAARLGRSRRSPIRPDWEGIRMETMRKAVRAKFTQHPDLGKLLLSTGDAVIVEHTEKDRFWGDGGDGRGENALGRILMELREELRANARDERTH